MNEYIFLIYPLKTKKKQSHKIGYLLFATLNSAKILDLIKKINKIKVFYKKLILK